jgi:hypothetical protein
MTTRHALRASEGLVKLKGQAERPRERHRRSPAALKAPLRGLEFAAPERLSPARRIQKFDTFARVVYELAPTC